MKYIYSDPWHNYEPMEKLGEGTFGVVYKARHRDTGLVYAVKLINKSQGIDEYTEREILNHKLIQPHPNIVGFQEIFATTKYLGIVMEFASGGDLHSAVARLGQMKETMARYYFQQIICGLEHLHRQGICHRDLKLENLLMDSNGVAPLLKICDFGHSKSRHNSVANTTVGTTSYMAPEVIRCDSSYDGFKADVWSAGVALYIMLVGWYPFEDQYKISPPSNTMARILRGQYSFPQNVHIAPECQHLLANMLVVNPLHRLSLQQIKQHPWYQTLLPDEVASGYQSPNCPIKAFPQSLQTVQDIIDVLQVCQSDGESPSQ